MSPKAIRTAKNETAVMPRRFKSPVTYLYSTDSGRFGRTREETVRALAADGRAAGEGAAAGEPGCAVGFAAVAGGVPLYRRGVLLCGTRRVFFLAILVLLLD
jgi:hypothetical protein